MGDPYAQMRTMWNFFKGFWRLKERRKSARAPVSSAVRFRIIDSKNPAIRSRILHGKVLDLSLEGLCIGTNTVQMDGLHVFHPSSQQRNRLEIEVELRPDLPPMRILAEVKWYSRVEDEVGWIYKMGVNWDSLSESDRQTLKTFLKTRD
ncbi:MAG: PilZ domain-containing protein [Syntrophaceae bacterium]|nr:PilZ domain-containing protein [Syntrophaceae bacterium]